MPTESAHPARARAALALALLALALLALPAAAGAGVPPAQRVAGYWTPQRMAEARPLNLIVGADGKAQRRFGRPEVAEATASFKQVTTPEVPPFSFNGRIFFRLGELNGFCSGTAINSPTRQLVLTAGHCIDSGPLKNGRRGIRYSNIVFVPAYTGGLAPFGIFAAKPNQTFATKQWIKTANVDFDLGAFLTKPNSEGVNLADAVGGGATIALNLPRAQQFLTFGYPGKTEQMQGCQSSYVGDDRLSFPLPGPPTMRIDCRWAPGASGGGWLIGDGTQINGVTSYLHRKDTKHTFGPYFTEETVGKLVRGL